MSTIMNDNVEWSSLEDENVFNVQTLAELEVLNKRVIQNLDKLLKEKERLCKLILQWFQQDYAVQAAKLYKYLKEQVELFLQQFDVMRIKTGSTRKELESILTELSKPRYHYINQINYELGELLDNVEKIQELENSSDNANNILADSWKQISSHDGIISYYRKEHDKPTRSFLVSGEVDSHIFNVLSIMYEVDLYKNWFPMCKSNDVIHVINNSRFRMLIQKQLKLIWPVHDRELALYAYGDCIGGKIAIYTRSVKENVDSVMDADSDKEASDRRQHNRSQFVSQNENSSKNIERNYEQFEDNSQYKLPEPLRHQVRADMLFGGYILKPTGVNTTNVSAFFNLDFKLSVVPHTVLNWFSHRVTHQLIKNLRHETEKWFGNTQNPLMENEYLKRIKKNRKVYGEIERRMLLEMPKEYLLETKDLLANTIPNGTSTI